MKTSNSSRRLKELMTRLNIKQTDIANASGLEKSVISMYVNGHRLPRQDKIAQIADAFNIDPAWLMGYDVPMMRNEYIEKKYSPDNAIALAGLDEDALNMISAYTKLTKEQQKSICSLVQSMLPNR